MPLSRRTSLHIIIDVRTIETMHTKDLTLFQIIESIAKAKFGDTQRQNFLTVRKDGLMLAKELFSEIGLSDLLFSHIPHFGNVFGETEQFRDGLNVWTNGDRWEWDVPDGR